LSRPYSKDMGYEDLDVSALLSVRLVIHWLLLFLFNVNTCLLIPFYFNLLIRCLPGYPDKCPRLQITPEKGLTKCDADNLLSLLNDQVKDD